jgi:hypothetical protein
LVRSKQLDLFGGALDAIDRVPLAFDAERELSTRVPEHVRFGTSSWTFRGWGGLVYPVGTTDDELVDHGLERTLPLLRTVGIDRSHYGPSTDPHSPRTPKSFRPASVA